jgi:hypothetical protein
MDDELFSTALRDYKHHGRLTFGDLRWFFGRDYHTVREWVVHKRLPTGARRRQAHACLERLVRLIDTRKGFPVPLELSKRDRAEYMRALGEGKLAHARLLATRAADGRVVRGVRQKRRTEAAVGVRND